MARTGSEEIQRFSIVDVLIGIGNGRRFPSIINSVNEYINNRLHSVEW